MVKFWIYDASVLANKKSHFRNMALSIFVNGKKI